ncbi:MAG: DUF3098 domain-containing protein [Bacteroidetes bacterium]|nr:DUF3098 domain-containing protein [Bacteroidota bacterium]
MDKNTVKKQGSANKPSANTNHRLMFNRDNYIWMFIGIGVIALGFILMSGTTDIYDTRKLVISPIVVLAGFAIEIYAIMKKPKEEE